MKVLAWAVTNPQHEMKKICLRSMRTISDFYVHLVQTLHL